MHQERLDNPHAFVCKTHAEHIYTKHDIGTGGDMLWLPSVQRIASNISKERISIVSSQVKPEFENPNIEGLPGSKHETKLV